MSDPMATVALATEVFNNLPPLVRQNAAASFSALIGALFDVPVAWLEGQAAMIRAKADTEAEIVRAHGHAAAEMLAADPELVERTKQTLVKRLFRSQLNREAIAKKAGQELRDTPPTEDASHQIDPDWLDVFSRVAETKSNEEMQAYFARLLAGEIRKPGTFSPATVEVLSRLTPDVANIFHLLCNISSILYVRSPEHGVIRPGVITSPYGSPGSNALQPLGLTFSRLCDLQDAGLIQSELKVQTKVPVALAAIGTLDCAGNLFRFESLAPLSPNALEATLDFQMITFTRAGRELRQLLDLRPTPEYIAKLRDWLTAILAGHDIAISDELPQ